MFLAGDYREALDLETQNFDAFSRKGSHFEVADSLTLLSAISWRLGETQLAWQRASEGLRYFWGTDSASGLVRNLGWRRSSSSPTATPSSVPGSRARPTGCCVRRA